MIRKVMVPALGLVALTVVAYIPALHAGFVWDDDQLLTENRLIRSATGLHDFWFTTKCELWYFRSSGSVASFNW